MYELSEAAAADIESIFEYSVVHFGLHQTQTYVESLQRCLSVLGENPGMGSSADDLREGYHRFTHQSHVIFYRVTGSGIWVARVLHKHMDVSRHVE